MLSIIGIGAIVIAIYLLGRAAGRRSVYMELAEAVAEIEEVEVSEFVEAQRMNALDQ